MNFWSRYFLFLFSFLLLAFLMMASQILFLTPLVTLPGILWAAYPRRPVRLRIFGALFLLTAAFVFVNASGAVAPGISELASLSVSLFMGGLILLFSILIFALDKGNWEITPDCRALLRGFALSFLLFLPYYVISVSGKHLWAQKSGGLPSPQFHPFIAVTLLSILLALSLLRFNLGGKKGTPRKDRLVAAAEKWGLSPRERDVLPLLFEGGSYKSIAEKLFISPSTAKKHALSIYRKAGVGNKRRDHRL